MSDCITILVIHVVLAYFLIRSIFECVRGKWRSRKDTSGISVDLTVKRGKPSMEALCYSYGVVSLAYTLAVSASDCNCIEGYKATCIIVDYIIFSYLFFLNSWFRNCIVFKFTTRVRED